MFEGDLKKENWRLVKWLSLINDSFLLKKDYGQFTQRIIDAFIQEVSLEEI